METHRTTDAALGLIVIILACIAIFTGLYGWWF
jgi:hypothetical protein